MIVESKVGEDGGTVRDKAARLKSLAIADAQRGLVGPVLGFVSPGAR